MSTERLVFKLYSPLYFRMGLLRIITIAVPTIAVPRFALRASRGKNVADIYRANPG